MFFFSSFFLSLRYLVPCFFALFFHSVRHLFHFVISFVSFRLFRFLLSLSTPFLSLRSSFCFVISFSSSCILSLRYFFRFVRSLSSLFLFHHPLTSSFHLRYLFLFVIPFCSFLPFLRYSYHREFSLFVISFALFVLSLRYLFAILIYFTSSFHLCYLLLFVIPFTSLLTFLRYFFRFVISFA